MTSAPSMLNANTPTLPKPQTRTPGSEPPHSPGNPKGQVDTDDCYKGLGNCPGSFLNASRGHRRPSTTTGDSNASSSDAGDSVDGLEDYLSSQVRAADSEHSTPEVNVTDCVLAVESDYYVSSRTTVTISQSVALGRVESSSRYDGSDGVMVSIRAKGASDVSHERSSGRSRRSRLLQIPVEEGFDFAEFNNLLTRAAADCR